MTFILVVLGIVSGIALAVSIFAILVAAAAWNEIKKIKTTNNPPSVFTEKKPFVKQDPRTHTPYAKHN